MFLKRQNPQRGGKQQRRQEKTKFEAIKQMDGGICKGKAEKQYCLPHVTLK